MIYYKTLIALIIVNLKLWKSVDYTHKRTSLYWRPIIYNEKSTSFGVKVSERYQKGIKKNEKVAFQCPIIQYSLPRPNSSRLLKLEKDGIIFLQS